MRIKLTVTYDGTAYCGWQMQPNGLTVQEVLQNAVFSVTGERVTVTGSGRTDAGVHAEGQTAHFDTEKNIPPENFAFALNTYLPCDIKVIKSERASNNFDARKSVKKKTYRYTFYKSIVELPLEERYAVRVNTDVDAEKMRDIAAVFVGEHDFKAFCASGSGAKTTIRTVYGINVTENDNEIKIYVTGNGFLYNMVRILAGTLLSAGEGKISKADAERMLAECDRALCGKTCPAKGLCLVSVDYGE